MVNTYTAIHICHTYIHTYIHVDQCGNGSCLLTRGTRFFSRDAMVADPLVMRLPGMYGIALHCIALHGLYVCMYVCMYVFNSVLLLGQVDVRGEGRR